MLVVCDNCDKGITVPDDKVPAGRRFAFNCPACQHKIKVEPDAPPAEAPAPAAPAPAPAAPAAGVPAPAAPEPADAETSFSMLDDSNEVAIPAAGAPAAGAPAATTVPMAAPAPVAAPAGAAPAVVPQPAATSAPAPVAAAGAAHALPPALARLRPHDQQLFTTLSPIALVVDHGVAPDPALEAELHTLGFDETKSLATLDEAVDAALEREVGMIMLRVQKASAPPFEPLGPLSRLSPSVRRRTFVALVADNVQSLDGQVAFLLQVNCLLSNRDRPKHPAMLLRALLFHLKLYQHWHIEQT